MPDGDHSGELDTGLHCLVILAHLHHLPANPKQVVHEFGSGDSQLEPRDLLRAAKWLGLKAKSLQQTWQQFTEPPRDFRRLNSLRGLSHEHEEEATEVLG